MMSLQDSLCHSNNGLAGNYVIGGLRPQLDLVIAHWPRPSYAFEEADQLWLHGPESTSILVPNKAML